MKKLYIFCFFIQLLSFSAYSQNLDTATNLSILNKIFSADSASFSLYEFAKSSPYYLKKLMPLQYSRVIVGYNYEKGNFMPAQGASKISDAYLKTEGSTQLKSVSLWGMFSYHKIIEDSTRYNHQTRNNISSPYYFGSPLNVSYERAIYNLKALAEKNLIGDNLPLGLGADYRIGNHFSTNDPRGSISDYQFNLIATLGYTFFQKLKFGAAYRYGYGQERVNVAYKNNSFSQNTLMPAYNNYLQNGYGEAYVKNTDRDYNNDQTRSGFDTYIDYTSSNLGSFVLSYSYLKEKQKYLRSNSLGIFKYNDYNLDSDNFNLLWFKSISNKKLAINLNYTNVDGADFNYTYLANNYIYNYNQLTLKSNLTINQGKNIFNYHVSANKNGEQREDGLTGNDIKYYRIDLIAGFGYNRQLEKSNFFGFNLSGIYSIPINDSFTVTESNVGLFTRTVIYQDYLYNTSSRLGGTASFNYSLPTFKGIQTEIKLGLTYLERTKMKDFSAITNLGKNRFSSNISLNLYFWPNE